MKFFTASVLLFALSGCIGLSREWDVPWPSSLKKYEPSNAVLDRVKINRPGEKINIPDRCPIDLDTTIRLAAGNNLDIALAREALHKAYAIAMIAQERFIPTLGPSYRFWRLEGETQATLGEFVNTDKQSVFLGTGVSARWPLGDVIFNTLSTVQMYESAKSTLDATSQYVVMNAAVAYFELLKEDQRVSIMDQAVKISDKLVNELQAAVDIKKMTKSDLLRARVQKVNNELALSRSRNALKQASIKLATILRIDPKIELFPAEATAIPIKFVLDQDVEQLVTKAINNRPDVTSVKKELEARKREQQSVHLGAWIPDVYADGNFGGFGGTFGNIENQKTYFFSLGWKVGPGGLFDSGRQHFVDAQVKAVEIGLAKMVQQIDEEVRLAYTATQSRLDQIKLAEQEVKDADEALKLSQERQAIGHGIPLEVIQAEEALTRARLDYIISVVEYNQAQFQLFIRIGNKYVAK